MEFNELLELRRSIRSYDKNKKVTKEQIEILVNAAIQAPSWKNGQASRYYAVLSDEKCKEFREQCLPEFNANNSDGAALVVTTFVDKRVGFTREGVAENECGNGWGYYDLGLHSQNFILKAKELGLDTLIMGIRDSEKIRQMLSVPENEHIVAVIAVGYADKEATKPKRKLVEDICKFY